MANSLTAEYAPPGSYAAERARVEQGHIEPHEIRLTKSRLRALAMVSGISGPKFEEDISLCIMMGLDVKRDIAFGRARLGEKEYAQRANELSNVIAGLASQHLARYGDRGRTSYAALLI